MESEAPHIREIVGTIVIRRQQGMIEDVVGVRSNLNSNAFGEVELFMNAQIHAVRTGAGERVALRILRIAEES
jgi:hypothetical protein